MSDDDSPRDLDVAKTVLDKAVFATMRDNEDIFIYDKGVFVDGAESFIKELVSTNINEEASNHTISEIIGHIKRRTYVSREEFDKEPSKLVLENGILDLETFEFTPHNPKHYSFSKLPVSYDPLADCPRIKEFLSQVMYAEDIASVQEFIGSCLWKGYETRKALMNIGEGANGKSTFNKVVEALLGKKNIASRSIQELENSRFAVADLYGKLANIYSDLPETALKTTGKFKLLTGNDPVTAEYKYRNGYIFFNYSKQIFSCNRIPEAYDDTQAYFDRWLLITYPNRFEGQNEKRGLLNELTTPQELSGFLNWAIEGLRRLKSQGWHLSNAKSTDLVREEYIRKSSPMGAFFMDCIEIKSDGFTVKTELYASFAEYCRASKLPIVTSDTFFKNLPRHGIFTPSRPLINEVRVWGLNGLTVKPKDQWGKKDDDMQTRLDVQSPT